MQEHSVKPSGVSEISSEMRCRTRQRLLSRQGWISFYQKIIQRNEVLYVYRGTFKIIGSYSVGVAT